MNGGGKPIYQNSLAMKEYIQVKRRACIFNHTSTTHRRRNRVVSARLLQLLNIVLITAHLSSILQLPAVGATSNAAGSFNAGMQHVSSITNIKHINISSKPFLRTTSKSTHPVLFSLNQVPRGGSLAAGEEEYDVEMDDDADEDEDVIFDEDDGMMNDFSLMGDGSEDDGSMYFDESNTIQRALEMWKTTPPFTKAYMSASMLATAVGYVTNPQTHQFPEWLLLDWKPTLFGGQIWRPLTAFLNFGPFGFGYVMTAHFVWTYMSTLEKLHHDKPYDFWVMILFGAVSMVCGYSLLGISPRFLGHNLSTFLVYIWSRYHEGMEVNVMELFNARAETLPWFFLAQTALLEGELPLLDMLGIAFGHIYHHAKVSKMLVTPRAIVKWYNDPTHPLATKIRAQYKEISADFEMQ